MRTVVETEPGTLELNYMMLPTFIGMNALLKKELEGTLRSKLEGQLITEEFLDQAHGMVIDFLVKKFPLNGLRDYLDSVKYVSDK